MISRRSGSYRERCAIEEPSMRSLIALRVISLLIVLYTIFRWIKSSKKHQLVKDTLPWYSYGVMLLFLAISWIMSIISTIANLCYAISFFEYRSMAISSSLFYEIASILALGIFAYSLVGQLFKLKSRSMSVPKAVNGGFIAIAILIWVPYFVILNWLRTQPRISRMRVAHYDKVLNAFQGIEATYVSLYLIATIVASGFLISVTFSKSPIQFSPKAKIWTLVTAATFVFVNFIVMINITVFGIAGLEMGLAGLVVFQIILTVFHAFALLGILMSAEHSSTTEIIDVYASNAETKLIDQHA